MSITANLLEGYVRDRMKKNGELFVHQMRAGSSMSLLYVLCIKEGEVYKGDFSYVGTETTYACENEDIWYRLRLLFRIIDYDDFDLKNCGTRVAPYECPFTLSHLDYNMENGQLKLFYSYLWFVASVLDKPSVADPVITDAGSGVGHGGKAHAAFLDVLKDKRSFTMECYDPSAVTETMTVSNAVLNFHKSYVIDGCYYPNAYIDIFDPVLGTQLQRHVRSNYAMYKCIIERPEHGFFLQPGHSEMRELVGNDQLSFMVRTMPTPEFPSDSLNDMMFRAVIAKFNLDSQCVLKWVNVLKATVTSSHAGLGFIRKTVERKTQKSAEFDVATENNNPFIPKPKLTSRVDGHMKVNPVETMYDVLHKAVIACGVKLRDFSRDDGPYSLLYPDDIDNMSGAKNGDIDDVDGDFYYLVGSGDIGLEELKYTAYKHVGSIIEGANHRVALLTKPPVIQFVDPVPGSKVVMTYKTVVGPTITDTDQPMEVSLFGEYDRYQVVVKDGKYYCVSCEGVGVNSTSHVKSRSVAIDNFAKLMLASKFENCNHQVLAPSADIGIILGLPVTFNVENKNYTNFKIIYRGYSYVVHYSYGNVHVNVFKGRNHQLNIRHKCDNYDLIVKFYPYFITQGLMRKYDGLKNHKVG